jgi:hypothetical protein
MASLSPERSPSLGSSDSSLSALSTDATPDDCVDLTVFTTTSETGEDIKLVLRIPKTDIFRLSLRPFKWLRYVAFAILGIPSALSTAKDSPPLSEAIMTGNELDHTNLWYVYNSESK